MGKCLTPRLTGILAAPFEPLIMETKIFVLDDENLVYGFFDELGICPTSIFAGVIIEFFPEMEYDKADEWAEYFADDIDTAIGAYGFQSMIEGEADETEEVEEATGLWGHFHFKITNVGAVQNRFEDALVRCFRPVVKRLKKEGEFNES